MLDPKEADGLPQKGSLSQPTPEKRDEQTRGEAEGKQAMATGTTVGAEHGVRSSSTLQK